MDMGFMDHPGLSRPVRGEFLDLWRRSSNPIEDGTIMHEYLARIRVTGEKTFSACIDRLWTFHFLAAHG